MTARALKLNGGAPRALPPGTQPWSVAKGEVEVYLVGPARRRLIAVVAAGRHIFPLPEGALALSVVATDPAELAETSADAGLYASAEGWLAQLAKLTGGEPAKARIEEIPALTAALDAHFAEIESARDLLLAGQLADSGDTRETRSTLAAALIDAAAALGRTIDARALPAGPRDFMTAPAIARIAGLRAGQVILKPLWWRDDIGGPLLLARAWDRAVSVVRWQRGCWRNPAGAPVEPSDYNSLAFRVYAPLDLDLSRFGGMARSVLRGFRAEWRLIVSAGLGVAVLGLLVPIATGWVFDEIVPSGAGGLLIAIGLALFVAALVSTAIAVARTLAVTRVVGRGETNMAAGVADHVLRLPARFFKTMSAGDFNQRLESLAGIRGLVMNIIVSAGITLIFAIVYLALMFVYDARMALAGIAFTLVHALSVAISRAAQIAPLREAAERDGKLAGLTYELLEGVAKLRSAAAEPRALARWTTAYAAERDATAAGERVGNHFEAFSDSWQIVTLTGLFAAAALLAAGDVQPGVFIAFLAAFAIFQTSFTGFCDSLLAIYTAMPLTERIRPILTAAPETGIGRADPGQLTGDIQASGLSFTYTEGTAPLLDGLSFAVRPGEHLAVVGASGSGKSTILRLLLGFERPLTGSLTFDGQELASLDPARVRAQIGVVLQSSQLFAGSISENIRGASGATLEQCMIAAERAGLGRDLKAMSMGLHTPITEGASTLSGGQRQRILIARALAASPKILFFDEATSALDNVTQEEVARTLDAFNATRVTIAHRLSTVRNADRICVLEKGKFVETGPFAELMAKNGTFAALARRQMLEK